MQRLYLYPIIYQRIKRAELYFSEVQSQLSNSYSFKSSGFPVIACQSQLHDLFNSILKIVLSFSLLIKLTFPFM